MRQTPLHDHAVATPSGLKAVLEDPCWRRYYIQDADLEYVSPATSRMLPVVGGNGKPESIPKGGKRRLDYLMYRADTPVVRIKHYLFITLQAFCSNLMRLLPHNYSIPGSINPWAVGAYCTPGYSDKHMTNNTGILITVVFKPN